MTNFHRITDNVENQSLEGIYALNVISYQVTVFPQFAQKFYYYNLEE